MEVPLKVILPKSELIVILDRSVFDALKESSFVDHFVPQLITIEKYTPFPILPKINNRPAVVTDTLYLIVAVLSFIVILTSISLILVLLFYREPITLTSLSIVISLQVPHIVRFTDTVLSLEFKDGTALALFKIFATPDILPNAKIFMYLLLSIYNIPVI